MKQFLLVLAMGVAVMSCKKNNDVTPFLNLNQTSLSIDPVKGATAELIVESNVEWQVAVSSGSEYLQVDKTSGKGNDTIHVTVIKENETRLTYMYAITATSGSLKAQVIVEHKPYNVQLSLQKNFGGSEDDYITDIIATKDGGLFLTGITASNNNGDVIGANHGKRDAWFVKLNSNHDTVWTRVMGGSESDGGREAIATADGGYIIAGYTNSNQSGDVGTTNGGLDWWIIKLTSNGETAWIKTLGGAYSDYAESIAATTDGGFVIAGDSHSSDASGSGDVMVAKFNSSGNVEWQKKYGGSADDAVYSVSIASNGAIFVAGSTESSNTGDVGTGYGQWDYLVMKLNANGDKEWVKVFGGNGFESARGIASTSDGGAVITGYTGSNQNGDVGATQGQGDVWVIKVNANGGIVWNSLLGGSENEFSEEIAVTPDGGYLIAGNSTSKDGDVGYTQGYDDLLLLKLNANGKKLWNKTFGGAGYEFGRSLLLNTDGSFYVCGYTTTNTKGKDDGLLLKYNQY